MIEPDSSEVQQIPLSMGYIHNFNIENMTFDLEETEWLTMINDSERLEALGITELPGGFYIYKPEKGFQTLKLADNCEYMIINDFIQHDVVDIEVFINNIHDYSPYNIEIIDGEVVSIQEHYVP